MTLEDDHGNYLDKAAFEAAYQALMPYYQHAQIRGHIAEKVVGAVVAFRTSHGLAALGLLTTDLPTAERSVLVNEIRANLQGANAGSLNPINDAVRAAAIALTT